MPMPPALAKFFEYSSVRNERQVLAAWPPLNGPSFTCVNICPNIELRNTASKSCAAARALAATAGETVRAGEGPTRGILGEGPKPSDAESTTSPRYQLVSRPKL